MPAAPRPWRAGPGQARAQRRPAAAAGLACQGQSVPSESRRAPAGGTAAVAAREVVCLEKRRRVDGARQGPAAAAAAAAAGRAVDAGTRREDRGAAVPFPGGGQAGPATGPAKPSSGTGGTRPYYGSLITMMIRAPRLREVSLTHSHARGHALSPASRGWPGSLERLRGPGVRQGRRLRAGAASDAPAPSDSDGL